jgi:hypothetical protein
LAGIIINSYIILIRCTNVPPCLGEPVFDRLEVYIIIIIIIILIIYIIIIYNLTSLT